MLICLDCGAIFEQARIVFERHGLDTPPAKRHRPATGFPQAVRVSANAPSSSIARKIFTRFNKVSLTFF